MPSLNWIGREAVERHHTTVPFHLLHADPKRSVGDPDSGNLLVEGDNLLALKALLPYYAGQVKCIYIDPPYNTGNEGWAYNDNVNSPQMRDWLGKVVEGDDLSRHDKWLCMMYPRLVLLRRFLSDSGTLWVSMDDNEAHYLKILLDEVFGRANFVANVLWQKRTSPDARLDLGAGHDHILVFAKDASKTILNKIPLSEKQKKNYKNPDNDPRGLWASADYSAQGYRPNQMYVITTPAGVKHSPPPGMCWKNVEEVFLALVADNRIWFGKDGKGVPRRKTFLSEHAGISTWSWWDNSEVGHNQEAKKEINVFFGAEEAFDTPKPTRLIERILQIATDPGDLVLDSFAGSGTTGHAVLKMGGGRHFILVEMEPTIATPITAERLKRVIEGYGDTEGLGSGFQYCTLGKTLFDSEGHIRPEVSFDELARFVYFKATGAALPKRKNGRTPLLGVHNDTAVYLLYNGILQDKSAQGGNALTRQVLAGLPAHVGPKIIYGTRCGLGEERLRREAITFKHIPTDLQVE